MLVLRGHGKIIYLDALFLYEETDAQRDAVPFAGVTQLQSGARTQASQLPNLEGWQGRGFILKDGFACPTLGLSFHKYMDQMSTAVLIITVKIWKQSRWPTLRKL